MAAYGETMSIAATQTVPSPVCPASSTNCTAGFVSIENGPLPSYVAIVSSGFSCLGSILIVVTFFALKDMRSGAQKIITCLAIADFVSAAGYIVGSANFLTHFNKTDPGECNVFQKLCEAQATFTSWSSLVSFLWTAILAFYFYLIIVYRRVQVAARLMPLYHIIAWGTPLLIVVPLVATHHLGYAPYAASNWCFVKDSKYTHQGLTSVTEIIIILFNGKLWEILTYIIVTVLFILITAHVAKTRRHMKDTNLEPRMIQIESRLLAIPIIFILLRMWGTIQFFLSLALAQDMHNGCVTRSIHVALLVLGVFQAIGDGGQGWGNAILYVFLSPTIREKLCNVFCGNCMDALEGRLGVLLESDESRNGHIQNQVSENGTTKRIATIANGKHGSKPPPSEVTPLVPAVPATGYGVKEYDTTTSGTNIDNLLSSTAT